MSDESPSKSRDAASAPMLHQARRDRWAATVATLAVATHSLSALIVIGWFWVLYGHRIPRWKFEYDRLGAEFSRSAIFLCQRCDTIANYWYVPVLLAPVALICDFQLTGLIARQIGLRAACLCAACITILLLSNIAVEEYILQQEMLMF